MEFFVFVLIAIVAGIVNKARQQQKRRPQQFAWPKPGPGTRSGQGSSPHGPPQPGPQHSPQHGPPPGPAQAGSGYPQGPPGYPQGPGYQPSPGFQQGMPGYQPPAPYIVQNLPPQQLPHHRPPQHQLPASRDDLDAQVRTLMAANNEVGAVRLLCDEADMGIIEAQKHARSLVAPAAAQPGGAAPDESGPGTGGSAAAEPVAEEYVGSAAFATSTFDTGEDDDVWASGWKDTPQPDDRSDIDELWQAVRDSATPSAAGAPAPKPSGGSAVRPATARSASR